MAIQFPSSRKSVDDRAKADVKSQLPTANPWLKNSFLGALVTGYSGRVYEFYLQLKNALLQMFPDTADGTFLERWGSYVSIVRNSATTATGYVVFTGTATSALAGGSSIISSAGNTYTTNSSTTISSNTNNITSLTRSGSVATAITSSEHGLATGMSVTIAGATPTGYDGLVTIVVTDESTFTYDVSAALSTPATGTITAAVDSARIDVTSSSTGKSNNLIAGSQLSLSSPISGIDSAVYVTFTEIAGGTDIETDEDYRERVLYRYQNPIAMFNESAIVSKARERAGVTRVWVFEPGTQGTAQSMTGLVQVGGVATGTVASDHHIEDGQYVTIAGAGQSGYNIQSKALALTPTTFLYVVDSTTVTPATGTLTVVPGIPNGQVKIYFTRDNDANIIPSSVEVNAVSDTIETIRPAHVSTGDVIVLAPTPISTDFTFTTITPNTPAMQTALTASLEAMFKDTTNVGEILQDSAYISVIWQTVDDTGALIRDFTLSAPSGDVNITEGQIPVLGTITFPS